MFCCSSYDFRNIYFEIENVARRILLYYHALRLSILRPGRGCFRCCPTPPSMPLRCRPTKDQAECCICLENMKVGVEANEMPCKHMFHKSCIAGSIAVDMAIVPLQDDTFDMFSDLLSSPCPDPNWWVIGGA